MPGIAVVSNPRSGSNKKNPELVRRLAFVLGEKGELAQPDGLDRLEDVVRDLRARDVDIICVNGGDGTVHKLLSSLVRVYADGKTGRDLRAVRLPLIGILKGGTMNTMARNIGLKQGGDVLLGRIVNQYYSEAPFKTVERNLIVVNGEEAGCLFGNGVLSRFLEAYYEGGGEGPWKAVKTIARAIWSVITGSEFAKNMFKPLPCRVKVDGQPWGPEAYAAVAAGTMADIGLGFRPFMRALEHPDHMHMIGICGPPSTVVAALPRMRMGLHWNRPDVIESVTRRFTIEADEPQSYMLDGDFLRCGQLLTVEAGPRVRFIVD
jgi:diacylglycerol kinase family enzyme